MKTNEELRVMVAAELGYKPRIVECELGGETEVWFDYPDGRPNHSQPEDENEPRDCEGRLLMLGNVPNYPLSLDACAEFEASLTDGEIYRYANFITDNIPELIKAKPRQRCIAFLKMRGVSV